MFLCKQFIEFDKMFNRISEVLQNAADVIAPPPSDLQDFEYHWKQVKNFYAAGKDIPKVHINNTNLPHHLEQMLQILLKPYTEEPQQNNPNECLEFLLANRPLDLLVQLSISDTPPGIKVCVLNWLRRFLTCIDSPPMDHASLFQPIQILAKICNGKSPSPYEEEEVLFLEAIAGIVRKEPFLINLFLTSHQHTALFSSSLKGFRTEKEPTKNALFECTKLDSNIRRVEIVTNGTEENKEDSGIVAEIIANNENCDIRNISSNSEIQTNNNIINIKCDCEVGERLTLMDAILTYFESPDSKIVVRACEGALIIASSPALDMNCTSVRASLDDYICFLINKLVTLCERIPDDIDPGHIEDSNIAWGLMPREPDYDHFIGRNQLHEFLCWLDYTNCVARECPQLSNLGYKFRQEFLLGAMEMALIVIGTRFTLVLMAKIVKQIDSVLLMEEIATWLVGESHADSYSRGDCLLSIVIENANDSPEVLLTVLQFIEALLDNPNERILHEMVFRYVNTRGYYDNSSAIVQTWSDEEDDRERRRGSADGRIKSKTFAPHNILKVINNFLLLLPRQIMSEAVGTCYEEYVQDASRHYKLWMKKTAPFKWPCEAITIEKGDQDAASVSPGSSLGLPRKCLSQPNLTKEPQCNDSGISEESFYEGPLLKMLFSHIRSMAVQPCELNLAVIAILSKLAFLPHPYLHEVLLNPEIPVMHGARTLWTSMQVLAKQLLLEVPRHENFQKKIGEAGKRLLSNPPLLCENYDETEHIFEAIVVLEEFCKELAAIAFVKYHHATE